MNQVSDTGATPLDMARRAGRIENVRFLEGVGGKTGGEVRAAVMVGSLDHEGRILCINGFRGSS